MSARVTGALAETGSATSLVGGGSVIVDEGHVETERIWSFCELQRDSPLLFRIRSGIKDAPAYVRI